MRQSLSCRQIIFGVLLAPTTVPDLLITVLPCNTASGDPVTHHTFTLMIIEMGTYSTVRSTVPVCPARTVATYR